MHLLKQDSDRTDAKGKPFKDLYLVWTYNGKVYSVRVRPIFSNEFAHLYAVAQDIPKGEPIEKYL